MVFQFNCSPCTGNDPAQDTVKFDPSLLCQKDKENVSLGHNIMHRGVAPGDKCAAANVAAPTAAQRRELAEEEARLNAERQAAAKEDERQKQEQLELKRKQLRAVEDARLKEEEEQRLEAERKHLQAAEDLRRKQEEDARAAAEMAERLRQEKEAAAAAERTRQEQEQQERMDAQKQAAIDKVQAFLAEKRFANVNDLRKSTFKAKRPLHSAVKINDAEIVRCLLLAGADPSLTNSSGKTPQQVTEGLNKKGSHSGVLAALATPRPA
jgi:hypothetical protein